MKPLAGVMVALASPVHRDGSVDEEGIARLVEHVLAGRVNGLLALGSTGETASLDEPARRSVLRAVVRSAGGRVPVLCGVAQPQLSSTIAEIEAAKSNGADAVLVAPPFYYPTDQAGVIAFYRGVAERASLPVLLYHIPQFTKVHSEPSTVAALAREGAIQGIKDSSRDFEYFEGVCIATRDIDRFTVFTGSDTMLVASLAAGGAGTICGAGNVAPAWVVEVYDEFQRGDLAAARVKQEQLYGLTVSLRDGVFPLAIKAALHALGVCGPWSAPPVRELPEPNQRALRHRLEEIGLLTPESSRQ